jgi:hypothetical protein
VSERARSLQIAPINVWNDPIRSAAGFRQLDAAPDPIEQLRVMPRLQSRDRMARGGLREIQVAGGLRNVLSVGDRNENAK